KGTANNVYRATGKLPWRPVDYVFILSPNPIGAATSGENRQNHHCHYPANPSSHVKPSYLSYVRKGILSTKIEEISKKVKKSLITRLEADYKMWNTSKK
ncbi:MAG TPA: hypothetical protein VK551_01280, partial [Thermodesulfobacteriota bacterium]|nr:hypothetical protein [Thermodesulfobacteriota bacterium]